MTPHEAKYYFTIGIVLAIWTIFMLAVLSHTWKKAFQEIRENRALRLHKFHARVMDRRQRASSLPYEQFVLFDYDGRQCEYSVSQEVYDIARVGQQGVLYIRSGKFEGFEPHNETKKADDIYERLVNR